MKEWYDKANDISKLTFTDIDGSAQTYDAQSVKVLQTIYTSILDFANIYPSASL
jgi:hypothetical protein